MRGRNAAFCSSVPNFLGYVFGNVAREMGRLHRWKGHFWARRASVIPVLDDLTTVARLRYVLSQGVKEGLVARPEQWPGATSTPGLLGRSIVGVWVDRNLETRAQKRGGPVDASMFTTRYALRLTPLPCWDLLSTEERHARVSLLIEEVVEDARATLGRAPMGLRRLLAQDPHSRPAEPAHASAPPCHASSQGLREAFCAAYRTFCDAFRSVARAVRDGAKATRAQFPPGSFPRPHWFVAGPAPFVSLVSASDDGPLGMVPNVIPPEDGSAGGRRRGCPPRTRGTAAR
jgi:hypothetical protein